MHSIMRAFFFDHTVLDAAYRCFWDSEGVHVHRCRHKQPDQFVSLEISPNLFLFSDHGKEEF